MFKNLAKVDVLNLLSQRNSMTTTPDNVIVEKILIFEANLLLSPGLPIEIVNFFFLDKVVGF